MKMDSIKGSDNEKIFIHTWIKHMTNLYIIASSTLTKKQDKKINSRTSPLFTSPRLHVIFLYNLLHLSSYLSLYVNLLL